MKLNSKKACIIKNTHIWLILILLILICLTQQLEKINTKQIITVKAQSEEGVLEPDREWLNENFWEWHTRTTTSDMAYNGRHIVLGEDIDFYGYGVTSYKDFLYKEYSSAGKKTFAFTVDETLANYHTLDGAGFIFNSKIQENNLSGYILLYRKSDICIYRLDNINVNKFETTANKTVANYGKLIKSVKKTSDKLHNLIINTTPTNISVIDNDVEILNLDLDYTTHVGESFGLISSYLQHNCAILSKISFKYFDLDIEDYIIPVLKTDENKNPLQGAKFQVKDEQGTIVREGISNKEGIYYIKGLTEGIYTVEEIEPPKTYKLNNTIYKFKVTNEGKAIDLDINEEMELVFENEPYKIDILNYVKDTENGIGASKVGLYYENGEPVIGADGKHIIIITDSEGKGTFTGIEPGGYIYKQLEVVEQYIVNSTEYKCVLDEEGNVQYEENKWIIYNQEINAEDEKLPSFLPNAGQETIRGLLFVIILVIIYTKIKLNKDKE